MHLKTLKDIPDLKGKTVFIRVDFNVPLDKNQQVKDDKRIRQALPTLKYLLDHGASRLILATHVGRPKGIDPTLSTKPMAEVLSQLMGQPVAALEDWGQAGLPEEKMILLENLRFHPAEKSKDKAERETFGRQLAALADLYVNEAFSNSHRDHASMTAVPQFIPGYAGLGVEQEASQMAAALENPDQPMVAVIGGLKADKLPAIDYLLNRAEKVLVAGALAFNLLKLKGYKVGASKVDDEGMEEMKEMAQRILQNPKLMLPTDAVLADAFSAEAHVKVADVEVIEEGWMALDIGPQTTKSYVQEIIKAKTILWFGPIGVFEMEPFSHGTQQLAEAMAQARARSIVGGGDSASAVRHFGLNDQFTLVSTGGGASLEMIEGKKMPGLEVLRIK